MKNAKKILERKRKIIVVLVVMVSFVSVLAWYQMKKAHAYQSYNTGGNKHFKDGHLTVNINGPNGKSDSLTMYIIVMNMKKIKMSAVGHLIIPDIHIR